MFERNDGIVSALADGAGGTGNGATAAQAIIDAVGASGVGADWSLLLAHLDQDATRLGGGQSTPVILSIAESGRRKRWRFWRVADL